MELAELIQLEEILFFRVSVLIATASPAFSHAIDTADACVFIVRTEFYKNNLKTILVFSFALKMTHKN